MLLKGYLNINKYNFVWFTYEHDNGSNYFKWYSDNDYTVYETTDNKRIKEIFEGINKFGKYSVISSNKVVIEKLELL